jgi:hypothetical protein
MISHPKDRPYIQLGMPARSRLVSAWSTISRVGSPVTAKRLKRLGKDMTVSAVVGVGDAEVERPAWTTEPRVIARKPRPEANRRTWSRQCPDGRVWPSVNVAKHHAFMGAMAACDLV